MPGASPTKSCPNPLRLTGLEYSSKRRARGQCFYERATAAPVNWTINTRGKIMPPVPNEMFVYAVTGQIRTSAPITSLSRGVLLQWRPRVGSAVMGARDNEMDRKINNNNNNIVISPSLRRKAERKKRINYTIGNLIIFVVGLSRSASDNNYLTRLLDFYS